MVTTLLMNDRSRAEFLLVAPTVSPAHIAFSQALGMVDKNPGGFLRKRLHVQEHLRKITDWWTKATLKIKAFDTPLIGQLRGGLLHDPEGLLVFITTQSDEPPCGAFRAELMAARAIRDGRTPGAMLPVLYEFPEDITNDSGDPPAWQDSRNWWMVTPNRDRSVTIKRLEDDWAQPRSKVRARSSAGPRSISISRSAWHCGPIAGLAPISGSGRPTRPSPWTLCSSGARWW
jgi:phage terminase large subunit-like protein